MRTCARCRLVRDIKGRDLCHGCHRKSLTDGTIGHYTPSKVDRRAQVLALIEDGITDLATIANRLGCTKNAAQLAVGRARRGGMIQPPTEPEPVAIRRDVPPGEPACIGAPLGTFDDMIPDNPSTYRDMAIDAALSYCARCPVAVREWCVEVVDPRPGCWTGVAGGLLFTKTHPHGVNVRAEVAS